MPELFRAPRLRYSLTLVIAAALLLVGSVQPAWAAEADTPKNKGLYLSPVRQFISQDAGIVKEPTITVGNFTADPMAVSFSVKAFSVNDYSYDFKFDDTPDNHVRFVTNQVRLKPNESRAVTYQINLPKGTKPGGEYYTLFATGSGETGDAKQQVQAASLLYLTVNGALTHGSTLQSSHISHFVFRRTIPYSLDIASTGNVHYFAFVKARLSGWFGGSTTTSETHLLLPHTTRHFDSSIASPFWPGVYHAAYGYSTDYQPAVTRASWIIYLPPWSLAGAVAVVWVAWIGIHSHKRRKARQSAKAATAPHDGSDGKQD